MLPAAPGAHRPTDLTDHPPGPGEVHVDHQGPLVLSDLVHRSARGRGDARVVDGDVDPAEPLLGAGDRLPYATAVADVGHRGEDGRAGVPAQSGGVLQLPHSAQRVGHSRQVGTDVQQGEVRALGRTGDRSCSAESAGGAGDEDRLALQPHRVTPWSRKGVELRSARDEEVRGRGAKGGVGTARAPSRRSRGRGRGRTRSDTCGLRGSRRARSRCRTPCSRTRRRRDRPVRRPRPG